MTAQDSFDDVMGRLRTDDPEAAREVFDRFAGRLAALARSRLGSPLRQLVDPEDVLQSVYKSFFRRAADGQFELVNWDSLWSLLTVLTVRKCNNAWKQATAGKRDVRRKAGSLSLRADDWEVLARDPTPEGAAVLNETVENLLCGLEARDQQIVMLAMQGATAKEIGVKAGCAERTVWRVLQHVKSLLEDEAMSY